MLRADSWRDIHTYSWHATSGVPIVGEDPMVWKSTEFEGVLHAVTHGGGWGEPYGFHYWSDDGGWSWHGTGKKVYENRVELSKGSLEAGSYKSDAIILSRRERPHVVFDSSGKKMLGLINGVTEAWPCTLQNEPDRPPCKHPYTPGVNPSCGPGSNGTSIWCPDDYCYTLFQLFRSH